MIGKEYSLYLPPVKLAPANFDRYGRRGQLPNIYFFVKRGGQLVTYGLGVNLRGGGNFMGGVGNELGRENNGCKANKATWKIQI